MTLGTIFDDELFRETIIQFLNWQLADERARNRSSELRSRTGTKKDDECLVVLLFVYV